MKDKLLTRDLPEDLDHLISLTIGFNTRLEERHCYFTNKTSSPPAPPPPVARPDTTLEPMQLDQARLPKEERERRFRDLVRLNCGGGRQFVSKSQRPLVDRGMVTHNPEVDSKKHNILGWSPFCLSCCLMPPVSAPQREEILNLGFT